MLYREAEETNTYKQAVGSGVVYNSLFYDTCVYLILVVKCAFICIFLYECYNPHFQKIKIQLK